jgi:O-antigen ligase
MNEDYEAQGRLLTWGFCFLLLMLPFSGLVSPKSASVIVPLAALVIIGAYLWGAQGLGGLRSRSWIAVAAFVGLATLSVAWAMDRDIALERISKLLVFAPIGISLIIIAKHSANVGGDLARKFLIGGVGVGVALLAWAVLTRGGLFALLNPDFPAAGALNGSNRGSVMLMLLASAAVLAARRLSHSVWFWVLLPGFGVLLFFAESQTALAGFVLWWLVFGVASTAPQTARCFVVWGGACFILVQPFLMLGIETIDPTRSFDINAASAGARLDIWIAVAHKVMEAPILGHGIEATRSITSWANDFLYFRGRSIPHPHNGILQVWIEFGVIGATMVAMIWVALTRCVDNVVPEDRPPLLALSASILIVIGVSHGLWQSWWLWGVFGIVAATLTQVQHGTDASR